MHVNVCGVLWLFVLHFVHRNDQLFPHSARHEKIIMKRPAAAPVVDLSDAEEDEDRAKDANVNRGKRPRPSLLRP